MYGPEPVIGVAVTEPLPEEQISSIALAVTEALVTEIQDVSEIPTPLFPQLELTKKYPTGPGVVE